MLLFQNDVPQVPGIVAPPPAPPAPPPTPPAPPAPPAPPPAPPPVDDPLHDVMKIAASIKTDIAFFLGNRKILMRFGFDYDGCCADIVGTRVAAVSNPFLISVKKPSCCQLPRGNYSSLMRVDLQLQYRTLRFAFSL